MSITRITELKPAIAPSLIGVRNRVIDATRLMSITANLGDTKSTLTHPATTTHGRISQEAREAAGIRDGLLRLAVGLESPDDLKADLARGLQ